MHLDGIKLSKISLTEKGQYYLQLPIPIQPLKCGKNFSVSPTHRNEIGKQLPRAKG